MSQTIDLKSLERRAYRESVQDGIMEIFIGGLLYICGLVVADPKITVVFIAIYAAYVLRLPRSLEAAKERYTYPRIGAVVLHAQKPKPLLTAALFYVLGAAVLAAAVVAVSGLPAASEWQRGLSVWLGLCLLGAWMRVYVKSGNPRYLIYALAALAVGIVIALIRLPGAKDYVAVYLIITGTLSALTGAITLARFVRSHPVLAQEVGDDSTNG